MNTRRFSRRAFLGSAAAATVMWRSLAQSSKPRVGCQANAFVVRNGNFEALLPVLKTIASLGYAGFECNSHLVHTEFTSPSEARKKIKATGLEFIGMHMSMADADAVLEATSAGGAALGCHNVVMSAAGLSQTGEFAPDALATKAERLEMYGKICKSHGLNLAYHNHMPEFANHNAEIQGLAERTNPELVSFLIDAGHGYQGGGNPAEFMRKNPHRIVGCHLKTFRNNTEQVPLGKGDFGFEDLAAAIRATGWTGWLIDEEGGGQTSDSAAVRPDRAYIRSIFGV